MKLSIGSAKGRRQKIIVCAQRVVAIICLLLAIVGCESSGHYLTKQEALDKLRADAAAKQALESSLSTTPKAQGTLVSDKSSLCGKWESVYETEVFLGSTYCAPDAPIRKVETYDFLWDGTFTRLESSRQGVGEKVEHKFAGTWELSNGELTLTESDVTDYRAYLAKHDITDDNSLKSIECQRYNNVKKVMRVQEVFHDELAINFASVLEETKSQNSISLQQKDNAEKLYGKSTGKRWDKFVKSQEPHEKGWDSRNNFVTRGFIKFIGEKGWFMITIAKPSCFKRICQYPSSRQIPPSSNQPAQNPNRALPRQLTLEKIERIEGSNFEWNYEILLNGEEPAKASEVIWRYVKSEYLQSHPDTDEQFFVKDDWPILENGRVTGHISVLTLTNFQSSFDDATRRGSCSVCFAPGQEKAAADYLRRHIEDTSRYSNIQVVAGQLPPEGHYYITNTRTINNRIEISFKTE